MFKDYGFLSFARKFGDKYCKKSMNAAIKSRINAAKTTSKRFGQKTAETARGLIGNKIANKITAAGKTKSKKERKII